MNPVFGFTLDLQEIEYIVKQNITVFIDRIIAMGTTSDLISMSLANQQYFSLI